MFKDITIDVTSKAKKVRKPVQYVIFIISMLENNILMLSSSIVTRIDFSIFVILKFINSKLSIN